MNSPRDGQTRASAVLNRYIRCVNFHPFVDSSAIPLILYQFVIVLVFVSNQADIEAYHNMATLVASTPVFSDLTKAFENQSFEESRKL